MRCLPALLLLVTTTLTTAPALSTAPVAQRLPAIAKPEHYRLWFEPDLQTDTFAGRTTIRVQLAAATSEIQLHAVEITFDKVRITAGEQTQDATVALHSESETASLTVAQKLPAGRAEIDITYKGILNDKLRGFYLSKANGRKYAVSQMEATDARRAFPSFDEPALKATFDISLTIDAGDVAISNGAQISDTPGPGAGKHTVAFATTKPMSTYLVALLVGDFTCREAKAGLTPVRVCSTPDKKALTGFALEAAVQQLAFYNDYFAIPYPFDKLDIVGIPDFAAGAMENTGAITFREENLLADPERASLSTKKTVAAVLSHEIAHQWFGDLVTMKWWDDIWLNEGFATWMANKPLAAWRPEWNVELDEVLETQGAISTDALQSTRPIRTTVETPEEINEVFDAIAYGKSAAVLRMVEAYVGNDDFRRGVASYLKKFSYANAAAEDFWTEVTRVSGKPVDRIMASYVDQPGVPLLQVASRCVGTATEVAIQQGRFAGAPKASPPPQTWAIPVCLKTGTTPAAQCEVISKQAAFKFPGCTTDIFVNRGSAGYFVTEYPAANVRGLSLKAETVLTPTERVGFLGDEWRMVRSARHDIGLFLDLAGELADDKTPAVVNSVRSRVAFTAEELAAAAARPGIATWIRRKFGPALEQSGVPTRDDDEQKQSRWAALAELVGIPGEDRQFQVKSRELASRLMREPASLPSTIAPAVLHVAAYGGDGVLYDQYLNRLKALGSQPEDYYVYFNALPYFRDPALVNRTLAFAISPEVRTQDTDILIAGVLSHPWGRDAAWSFVTREWSTLTERLGVFMGLPSIVGATGNFCSAAAATKVKQFFAAHPVPSAERTVRQAIERIENCAAMKARQSPALTAWLRTQSGSR